MINVLNWIATVLSLVGAVAAGAFVLTYSRSPFQWREYPAGRHLMRFTLGVFIVLAWSTARIPLQMFYDGHPEFEFAVAVGRLAVFGYVAAMLVSRLRLLLKSREEVREEQRPLP